MNRASNTTSEFEIRNAPTENCTSVSRRGGPTYRRKTLEKPTSANATEVADELGIARSTFTEHLAATQTKLMDAILDP